MRRFLRDLWSTFLFALALALGIMVAVYLLRLLSTDTGQALLATVFGDAPAAERLATAVKIVGGLFATTWGLHLLNRSVLRGALIPKLGYQPTKSSLLGFFTFPFVHGSDQHLFGNTRLLLLFAGIMGLLVPNIQAFIVATIVLMFIAGIGVLMFGGTKAIQVGASGVVLGYYSFDLAYGFLVAQGWGTAVSALMLLFFGRRVWGILRLRGGNISHVGHFWGFIGGILAAAALSKLGV